MSAAAETGSRHLLKSSFGVAAATFLSRLLGLLRVRLESSVLGGSGIASSWFLAFMIPNLFRRILGEGALGTALIPLIAECDAQKGREAMRRQLAVVFAMLGTLLAAIVVVVSLLSIAVLRFSANWGIEFFQRDYVYRIFQLLPLLMPYAFFICLVGILGGVLNYAKYFVLPALGSLLLNVFLISGLYISLKLALPPTRFLPLLALLTPVSGAIQLLLMLLLLRRCNAFPLFEKASFLDRSILRRLWRLALPAVIGYSALQVSLIVDRVLAATLGSRAVPALTYVDRIIDLPIGIFAVSFGSVLMASMARSAAAGKLEEMQNELAFSLRHVWFICLPMAAGVVFFHESMLRLLCLGGRYTMEDLAATRLVAVFYGSGIPFFCALKVILPAFYARKKMKTPLIVSLIAIAVNIVLNLLLMQFLAQGGIALATVLSSWLQNVLLLLLLRREGFRVDFRNVLITILRSALLAAGIGALLCCAYELWIKNFAESHWYWELTILCAIGAVFVAIYFVLSLLLRAPECGELIPLLSRRRAKRN